MEEYLNSKRRVLLMTVVNMFLLYNSLTAEGDSRLFSLVLQPIALLSLHDAIKRVVGKDG